MDKQKWTTHREWRGLRDTLYDYFSWLILWGRILVSLPKAPVHTESFLIRLPAVSDFQLAGLRALPFRCTRRHFNALWKRRLVALRHGTAVFLAPSVPPELLAGFPKLTGIPMSIPGLSLSCPLPLSVEGFLECIQRLENTTREKFDWDAFFSRCRQHAFLVRALEYDLGGVNISLAVDTRSPKAALDSLVRSHGKKISEK